MRQINLAIGLGLLMSVACSSPKEDETARPGVAAASESAAKVAAAEPVAKPAAEPAAAPPTAPAVADPASAQEPSKAALDTLMRGHFSQATAAREALIRGDVEVAKQAMSWLSDHDESAVLPPALLPLYAAMRTSAGEFAHTSTLREAGVALATTLSRCADCHRTAGRGPKFATPAVPSGDDPKSHMQRHLWVAQRMWEGLVDGNESTFQEAGKLLAKESWDTRKLTLEESKKTVAQSLDEHVHALSADAASAATPAARADVYGHFIATCAACHRLLGKGPGTAAAQP